MAQRAASNARTWSSSGCRRRGGAGEKRNESETGLRVERSVPLGESRWGDFRAVEISQRHTRLGNSLRWSASTRAPSREECRREQHGPKTARAMCTDEQLPERARSSWSCATGGVKRSSRTIGCAKRGHLLKTGRNAMRGDVVRNSEVCHSAAGVLHSPAAPVSLACWQVGRGNGY
jgi:hypothetical protein